MDKTFNQEMIYSYIEKSVPDYKNNVIDKLMSTDADEGLAEKSIIEFYKHHVVKPRNVKVKWYDTPKDVSDKHSDVTLYPSYFNVNWVYFYNSFYEHAKDYDGPGKNTLNQYDKLKDGSKLLLDTMLNTFATFELYDGELDAEEGVEYVVGVVRKPTTFDMKDGALHSTDGPACVFGEDKLKIYYIKGEEVDEDLWIRTIKSSKNISDKARLIIDSSGLKPIGLEDILSIEERPLKNAILSLYGYEEVLHMGDVIDEETIKTSGGFNDYKLYRVNLNLENDGSSSRFISITNSKTGVRKVSRVNSEEHQCSTAIGAAAWTKVKDDGTHFDVDAYLRLTLDNEK